MHGDPVDQTGDDSGEIGLSASARSFLKLPHKAWGLVIKNKVTMTEQKS